MSRRKGEGWWVRTRWRTLVVTWQGTEAAWVGGPPAVSGKPAFLLAVLCLPNLGLLCHATLRAHHQVPARRRCDAAVHPSCPACRQPVLHSPASAPLLCTSLILAVTMCAPRQQATMACHRMCAAVRAAQPRAPHQRRVRHLQRHHGQPYPALKHNARRLGVSLDVELHHCGGAGAAGLGRLWRVPAETTAGRARHPLPQQIPLANPESNGRSFAQASRCRVRRPCQFCAVRVLALLSLPMGSQPPEMQHRTRSGVADAQAAAHDGHLKQEDIRLSSNIQNHQAEAYCNGCTTAAPP